MEAPSEQPPRLPSAVDGYTAYDIRGVERFLLEACEERGRLLEELATTRRRIAEADSELAGTAESEFRLARAVKDAQRLIRDERRANERAISTIVAQGESMIERVMVAAHEQVRAMQASLRGMDRSTTRVREARQEAG